MVLSEKDISHLITKNEFFVFDCEKLTNVWIYFFDPNAKNVPQSKSNWCSASFVNHLHKHRFIFLLSLSLSFLLLSFSLTPFYLSYSFLSFLLLSSSLPLSLSFLHLSISLTPFFLSYSFLSFSLTPFYLSYSFLYLLLLSFFLTPFYLSYSSLYLLLLSIFLAHFYLSYSFLSFFLLSISLTPLGPLSQIASASLYISNFQYSLFSLFSDFCDSLSQSLSLYLYLSIFLSSTQKCSFLVSWLFLLQWVTYHQFIIKSFNNQENKYWFNLSWQHLTTGRDFDDR